MQKFFETVHKTQGKITGVLMLFLTSVVTIQIFVRVLFRLSTPWTEELAKYTVIYVTFIGSVGAIIKGQHLLVDVFTVRFNESARRIARVVNNLIYLFFSGFLLIFGIQLCTNPIVLNSVTPAMGIPKLWLYIILPVSMAFMAIFSIYDLALAVRSFFVKGANDAIDKLPKKESEAK